MESDVARAAIGPIDDIQDSALHVCVSTYTHWHHAYDSLQIYLFIKNCHMHACTHGLPLEISDCTAHI